MNANNSSTKLDLNALKSHPGVLRIYGGRLRGMRRVGKDYMAYCPFHDDKNPSFRINLHDGIWMWSCFPCQARGEKAADSIIGFVAKKDGVSEGEAIKRVAKELGETAENSSSENLKADSTREPEPTKFKGTEGQVQAYIANLPTNNPFDFISHKAGRYLLGSGLAEIAESLKFGYTEKKYFNCHQKCENCKDYAALTIPLYRDGELAALKYRNLETPDKEHKWSQEKGSKADFLWLADLPPANPQSKVVGIFEGISDTALVRALGFNSVGILSAAFEDTKRFRESVSKITSTYDHVVLIGDNDATGRDAMLRLDGFFDNKAIYIPLPSKYKDLSEFFKATDAKTVSEWLRLNYKGAAEAAQSQPHPPTENTNPLFRIPEVYPLEVWNGTDYGAFADACGKNNYIPKEFFIESLKTLVGAAAGHKMGVKGTDQEARFYTAFIGPAGSGKSTAMSWAMQILPNSLLYNCGNPLWEDLGCFKASYGSQPGLIKDAMSHHQILQHNDELTTLADKFRVPGSGLSFLSLINQLYERTDPPSNKTRHTTYDVEKPLHFSLLGATTPDKWEDTFGGTGTEGSGFFQRLNIIGSEETRTVVPLTIPDLQQFVGLVEKLKALREKRYDLSLNPEATALLQKWHEWLLTHTDVDTGRLQVLALRNAAHLGWQLGGAEPEEVIRRAIMLSNYQLAMRRKYKAMSGDTMWSKMENLIRRHVQKAGQIRRWELSKKVHAERFGTMVFNKVLELLVHEGQIKIITAGKRSAEWVVWTG